MSEFNVIPVYQIYSNNSDIQSPNYVYTIPGTNNIDPNDPSNYYQMTDDYLQNTSTKISNDQDTYINLDNQNIMHDQSTYTSQENGGIVCKIIYYSTITVIVSVFILTLITLSFYKSH